jgi:fatty acid desaturase
MPMAMTDTDRRPPRSLVPRRDYSLTGAETQKAIAKGLAAAEWYHADVPRKVMKELMQRKDGPAIRDTVIWIGLMVVTAVGGIMTWGSWWTVPFWAVYGILYGSCSDSRWHEAGHGTAFRTDWMNDAVYHIASFMIMRNPVSWRWSHARHHTDTIIVGRDPEIAFMHPASILLAVGHLVGVYDIWVWMKILVRNAMGDLNPDERSYIPDSEVPKAIFWARVHVAIYAATFAAVAVMYASGSGWASIIPLMLILGPRIYGTWHAFLTGMIQHGGLAEDVLDHRLNSRTVLMNPVSRFIYWNMNYHIEHHMFPMVPYHALPRLHALIRHDLPPPNPSIWHAYREMVPAILRQRREPGYYLRRDLPPTARPYREELHDHVPSRAAE